MWGPKPVIKCLQRKSKICSIVQCGVCLMQQSNRVREWWWKRQQGKRKAREVNGGIKKITWNMCSRLWLDDARPWCSTDADLSNITTNLIGFRTDILKRLCGCVLVKMYTKYKKKQKKTKKQSKWLEVFLKGRFRYFGVAKEIVDPDIPIRCQNQNYPFKDGMFWLNLMVHSLPKSKRTCLCYDIHFLWPAEEEQRINHQSLHNVFVVVSVLVAQRAFLILTTAGQVRITDTHKRAIIEKAITPFWFS